MSKTNIGLVNFCKQALNSGTDCSIASANCTNTT